MVKFGAKLLVASAESQLKNLSNHKMLKSILLEVRLKISVFENHFTLFTPSQSVVD